MDVQSRIIGGSWNVCSVTFECLAVMPVMLNKVTVNRDYRM